MPHIDQNRSFEERLKDFGPELGPFLGDVWKQRQQINVDNFKLGRGTIYKMYAGTEHLHPYNPADLKRFLTELRRLGASHEITCQGMKPKQLVKYSDAMITVHGHGLWKTFYHVIHKRGGPSTAARAYVHAADNKSLSIMALIIGQFGKNRGLWEVKTAGPGTKRLDTIVAYFYDRESRNEIVGLLKQAAKQHPDWFIDSLPPLVKREDKGIGSADNPPKIEIVKGKDRHSFGSFYATLAWLALKTTPNLRVAAKAEPRHMLDNVLYCMRLLRISPNDPQQFPAKDAIESWYQTQLRPIAN